jgi:hypothetical protein
MLHSFPASPCHTPLGGRVNFPKRSAEEQGPLKRFTVQPAALSPLVTIWAADHCLACYSPPAGSVGATRGIRMRMTEHASQRRPTDLGFPLPDCRKTTGVLPCPEIADDLHRPRLINIRTWTQGQPIFNPWTNRKQTFNATEFRPFKRLLI